MANYANLISAIQTVITENGNNEITGPLLQQTLVSIINALGSGYQFIGIATPETTPGTPDQKVFYIGSAGTYPNFGPAVIPDGNLAVFYYDSDWHFGSVAFPIGNGAVTTPKIANGAVTAEKLSEQLNEQISHFVFEQNAANTDLDIVDENGNVLARFKNGGFRIKNFDSDKTPQQGDAANTDLDIADENGNVLARFSGGHIKTKNFDSRDTATTRTRWYGKKVSIIGDSISTAPSHNAVEFTVLASDISAGRTLQGYPTYYDIGTKIGTKTVNSSMVGVLTSFSPVSGDAGKTIGKAQNYNTAGTSGVASYTDTWWYKLASALGMEILQNVSWSGASISSHESETQEFKTSYAWHPAQINKLSKRDSSGNRINPDIIIIYRGTNDMSHSPYTILSDFGAGATSIPDSDVAGSSYDFKIAYCLTIKKIREAYPQAQIVLCTLNVFKRINYSQFPTNNGINTLPEYNNAIREIADMMGCGIIELDKDGITFENCYPTYISDSSTIPTHPNPTGHTVMAEKAIVDLKKF